MNSIRRRLLLAVIGLGAMAWSTVWLAVPTQAPTGVWTIAYPLSTDEVSISGGLSCGGSAMTSSSSYYLQVVQGTKSTTNTSYPLSSYFYDLWSTVVGSSGSFTTGSATLKVWPDANMTGSPLVSVTFTFVN
jgi:hypothetical protein